MINPGNAPVNDSGYPYFTKKELACSHCGEMGMDELFMDTLIMVRYLDGQGWPMNCGYRCLFHPIEVAKKNRKERRGEIYIPGAHPEGRGGDRVLRGTDVERIVKAIMEASDRGYLMRGFGLRLHGDHKSRFGHVDDMGCRETDTDYWKKLRTEESSVWTYA